MYKETKLYLGILGVLGVCEFFLSIPLAVDSILNSDKIAILMMLGALHLFSYAFVTTGLVEYYYKSTHIVGALTILTNFIPFVAFIPHIFVLILIISNFRNINKRYEKDVEKRIRKQDAKNQD